jgi:hypothetical protein
MSVVRTSDVEDVAPLCVDVKAAARLIGVSVWTLRAYIDEGLVHTVKFPSSKHPGEQSRRVLIAVADLQAFVDQHRDRAAR